MELPKEEHLAQLWIGDQPEIYVIAYNNNNSITARNAAIPSVVYNLTKQGGDTWIIDGDPTANPVHLSRGLTLTGVDAIDTVILANVDDDLLEAVCAVDIRVRAICHSDEFWLLKMHNLNNKIIIPSSYKGDYRELYNEIKDTIKTKGSPIEVAVSHGFVDMLLAFPSSMYNERLADTAANSGQVDILGVLSGYNILPTTRGVDLATAGGHLAASQWIYQHTKLLPSRRAFDIAVGYGHRDVVQWLTGMGYHPTVTAADTAAFTCNLGALVQLGTQGIYPTTKGIKETQESGCGDVLKWLTSKGRFSGDDVDLTALIKKGNVTIFKWIGETFGIYPTEVVITQMVVEDRLDLLEWAVSVVNVVPNPGVIDDAIKAGSLDTLKWAYQHGMLYDHVKDTSTLVVAVDNASKTGDFLLVEWLVSVGLLHYNQDLIDTTLNMESVNGVKWLVVKHHLWPGRESLAQSKRKIRLRGLVQWLDENRRR